MCRLFTKGNFFFPCTFRQRDYLKTIHYIYTKEILINSSFSFYISFEFLSYFSKFYFSFSFYRNFEFLSCFSKFYFSNNKMMIVVIWAKILKKYWKISKNCWRIINFLNIQTGWRNSFENQIFFFKFSWN